MSTVTNGSLSTWERSRPRVELDHVAVPRVVARPATVEKRVLGSASGTGQVASRLTCTPREGHRPGCWPHPWSHWRAPTP